MNNFWSGFYKQAASKIKKEVSTVAVINGDRMLMGKRRDNGKWTNPGGHLDEGESPLDGAVRELYEESGIKADPSRLRKLRSKNVTKPDGTVMGIHTFRYDVSKNPPTSMKQDPDGEVYRWHWVNYKGGLKPEILNNLHVPAEDNVLLKALGIIGEEKVAKDLIPGGLADNKPDYRYPAEALLQGVKHEMEHTGDRDIAKEIAKDHLEEDVRYYDKLSATMR